MSLTVAGQVIPYKGKNQANTIFRVQPMVGSQLRGGLNKLIHRPYSLYDLAPFQMDLVLYSKRINTDIFVELLKIYRNNAVSLILLTFALFKLYIRGNGIYSCT